MRRAESVFSLMLTLLCVGYLYFVRQMDVGTLLDPGPGFMPAVVGVMALAEPHPNLGPAGSLKNSLLRGPG